MEQNKEADLQQLKALALAATPGPWELETKEFDGSIAPRVCVSSENDEFGAPRSGMRIGVEEHHEHPARKPKIGGPAWGALGNRALANARFIAEANPSVVLDLIARIERLQEDLDLEREHLRQAIESIAKLKACAASGATASGDKLPVKAGDKVIEGGVTQTLSENGATVYNALKAAGQAVAKIQARAAVSAATKPTNEQIAEVISHLIGNGVMDWKPSGSEWEEDARDNNEERRALIAAVNKARAATKPTQREMQLHAVAHTAAMEMVRIHNALGLPADEIVDAERIIAHIAATKPTAEMKPSFHVIVDGQGIAEYVTMTAREAQEHISDACGEGVEGAGKWRSVPVSIAKQWTKESVEKLSRELAEAVAKNASTVPQLTFPHIYLGLCSALIGTNAATKPTADLSAFNEQIFRTMVATWAHNFPEWVTDDAVAQKRDAYWRSIIDYAQSLLATKPAAPALPEGWKLVPILATNEMVRAAETFDTRTCIWDAMVHAAPAAPMASADAVIQAKEQAIEECWSANNQDFSHQTLEDLLDANDGLKPGDTVWIADAVRPDLNRLIDADDVMTTMGERAYDIAGEAAEDYPDASKEAEVELNALLAAWISKNCAPNFWSVENVRPYRLSGDDFPSDPTPINAEFDTKAAGAEGAAE